MNHTRNSAAVAAESLHLVNGISSSWVSSLGLYNVSMMALRGTCQSNARLPCSAVPKTRGSPAEATQLGAFRCWGSPIERWHVLKTASRWHLSWSIPSASRLPDFGWRTFLTSVGTQRCYASRRRLLSRLRASKVLRFGPQRQRYTAARRMQDQGEEGMAELQRGIAAWRATGANGSLPYYHTLLAEAFALLGNPKSGIQRLEEAQTLVEQTEDRWGRLAPGRIAVAAVRASTGGGRCLASPRAGGRSSAAGQVPGTARRH